MIATKMVPFMDAQLIAVKDGDGQVWAGVRHICKGIGLSPKQCDRQVANIHTDAVLSQGSSNLRVLTNGGEQIALCLKLEYLPLWLAKISITPSMQQSAPEVVERLVQYQLKAKDVLAEAFLEKKPQLPKDYVSALRALADSLEEKEALEKQNAELQSENDTMRPKAFFADAITSSPTCILVRELSKILKQNGMEIGQNRLFTKLREEGFLISKKGTDYNMPTQKSMEMGLFEVKETPVLHSDGHVTINKTPKVTSVGQQYFVNRFLKDEDIPRLETCSRLVSTI